MFIKASTRIGLSISLLLCLTVSGDSCPQEPSATNSGLTRLLLTAIDKNGHISRLTRSDISLQEDGKPTVIDDFKIQINVPTSVVIMIDASESQKRLLPLSKSTARVFVKGFVRAGQDQATVMSFAESVVVRQALTDNVEVLRSSINAIEPVSARVVDVSNGKIPDKKKPVGYTALSDAIIFACEKSFTEPTQVTRKAILLFTDGIDRGSTSKMRDAIESAVKKDIAIYVVALPTMEEGSLSLREDQPKLRKLSDETGGRAYFPAKNEELESVLSQVELNLRAQYILTFRSATTAPGRNNRHLQIEVVSPQGKRDGVQLAYRHTY